MEKKENKELLKKYEKLIIFGLNIVEPFGRDKVSGRRKIKPL